MNEKKKKNTIVISSAALPTNATHFTDIDIKTLL
jgi:hypothetical protein